MDLSKYFQWMLSKTNFTGYILQSNAYKTTEFLFTFFAFFDFLTELFLFRDDVRPAEIEYIHNYDIENE